MNRLVRKNLVENYAFNNGNYFRTEALLWTLWKKRKKNIEKPHKVDGEGAEGVRVELVSISSAYIRNNFNSPLPTIATVTLREKCPYSEFFWSLFSRIRTEYGDIWSISPYSIRMRENTDQRNSEYKHFSRSVTEEGLAIEDDEYGGSSKKSIQLHKTDYILAQIKSLHTKVDQLGKRNSSSLFWKPSIYHHF